MRVTSNTEQAVRRLSRGLVANNRIQTLEAYRVLYRAGSDCIPQIRTLLSDVGVPPNNTGAGFGKRVLGGGCSLRRVQPASGSSPSSPSGMPYSFA